MQTPGLHPKNERIVHLFRLSLCDVRIGDIGALTDSTVPTEINAVLSNHPDWFPTLLARQQAFQMIWLLGKIATKKRSEREEILRKRQMERAKHEAESKRRHR